MCAIRQILSCAQKAYDSGEFQASSDTEGTGEWPL